MAAKNMPYTARQAMAISGIHGAHGRTGQGESGLNQPAKRPL